MSKVVILHKSLEDFTPDLDGFAKYLAEGKDTITYRMIKNIDFMFGDEYGIEFSSDDTNALFVLAHSFMIHYISAGEGMPDIDISLFDMRIYSDVENITRMITENMNRYMIEMNDEMFGALRTHKKAIENVNESIEKLETLFTYMGVDKFPDVVRELVEHLPEENQEECKMSINDILARTVN